MSERTSAEVLTALVDALLVRALNTDDRPALTYRAIVAEVRAARAFKTHKWTRAVIRAEVARAMDRLLLRESRRALTAIGARHLRPVGGAK